MPNLSSKEIQKLQEKAADLEAKLGEKDAAIANYLNEKQALATALLEAEQSRQDAEAKRQSAEAELASVSAKLKKKEQDYALLVQEHMAAQRHRFGCKTERVVDENQEPLFPELEREKETNEGLDTPNTQNPSDIENLTYTGGKGIPSEKKKKPRGPHKPRHNKAEIPHRENLIPIPPEERMCRCCGKEKTTIGYDCKEWLNYRPSSFEIIIDKREKMACRNGCEGQVQTAPQTPNILPKCKATASLHAYLCVSKVLDRQPLYHLEKMIEQRHHWHISRQTMARWMIMLSDKLQPLVSRLKDQLENYDIAAIDATTLQVLNEPERASTTKSQAYCIRGGPPGKSVILYEYNAYRQSDYVDETLHFFKGILHCDASPVFNKVGKQAEVRLSYCFAHARRKFEEVLKLSKKGQAPLAREAVEMIGHLYKIERQAKENKLTPEARHALRQEKSRPIMAAFYDWLTLNKDRSLALSPIGKAIAYTHNHWEGLQTFLSDGRVEIDNNATERDIKPFVIARKNFLFACTPKGADSLGVHFSLILTAQRHGLDPIAYYTDILTRIANPSFLPEHFDALLPWNWAKP